MNAVSCRHGVFCTDKESWRPVLLTNYIQSAMRHARYEILPEGTYYGEIPGFQGVYANEPTLEACREALQEALEGWILLGLR